MGAGAFFVWQWGLLILIFSFVIWPKPFYTVFSSKCQYIYKFHIFVSFSDGHTFEPDKVWSTTELLAEYRKAGGTETNTTKFVQRVKEYLKDLIYCFKA